jgi:hypothetical protein
MVRMIFRGSRGGMWRRIGSPVLETLHGDDARSLTDAYKETKSQQAMKGVGGVHSTVLRIWDNITRSEGRNPALFAQPKSGG